jgi:hypothetical protein
MIALSARLVRQVEAAISRHHLRYRLLPSMTGEQLHTAIYNFGAELLNSLGTASLAMATT